MGYLVLPRSVADERDQINADRREQVFSAHAKEWTEQVRHIDPTLRVVQGKEGAQDPDVEPGKWYLEKEIPGSVNELMELPRPPGGWLYDWLAAADMWNPRVHRSRREAAEKLREGKIRARKLEAEQRQDHMREGVRAALRMRDDRGMTHSSAAKRRGDGIK